MQENGKTYQFDRFLLKTDVRELLVENKSVQLTKKSSQILELLVKNSNHLVPKEVILREVWEGMSLNEGVLAVNIATLRKILGKKEDGQEYIVNKARKGYIFACEVKEIEPQKNLPEAEKSEASLDFGKRFNRFIGRETELRTLAIEYVNLIKHHGNTVIIQGEAGIGKTSLANEFSQRLDQDLISVYKAEFFDYEGSRLSSSQTFFRLLWQIMFPDNETLSYNYSVLQKKIAETYGINLPNELAEIENAEASLKTPYSEDIYRAIIPLGKVFSVISKEKPLLLILDDVQYADRSGLEFLSYLTQMTASERILLIFLARNEVSAGNYQDFFEWQRRMMNYRRVKVLELSIFPEEDSLELIKETFKTPHSQLVIPESDFKVIYKTSAGNPYFLVEIIHWLVMFDQISFVKTPVEKWVWKGLSGIPMPDTLVKAARFKFESSSPRLQRFLEVGAVLGEKFKIKHLEKICQTEEAEIYELLKEALKQGIIKTEKAETNADFSFYHSIQRKVIYDVILPSIKQNYHQKIAEVLAEETAESPEKVAERIAYHYQFTDKTAEFIKWGFLAGKFAKKHWQWTEALGFFEAVYQKIDDLESCQSLNNNEKLQLILNYIECLAVLNNSKKALAIVPIAKKFSRKYKDKKHLALAYLIESRCQTFLGNYPKTIQSANQALKFYKEIESKEGEYNCLRSFIYAQFGLGNYPEVIKTLQVILPKTESYRIIRAELLMICGFTLSLIGKEKNSVGYLRESILIAEEVGDTKLLSSAKYYLGRIYHQLGKYEEAVALALEIVNKINVGGIGTAVYQANHLIGTCRLSQRLYEEVIEIYQPLLIVLDEAGLLHAKATIFTELSTAYRETKQIKKAKACINSALEILREIGNHDEEVIAYIELIKIQYLEDSLPKIEETIKTAFEVSTKTNNQSVLGLLSAEYAEWLLKNEKFDEALQKAETAVQILQKQNHPKLFLAMTILGDCYLAKSRWQPIVKEAFRKKAEKCYLESLKKVEEIKNQFDLDVSENVNRYVITTKAFSFIAQKGVSIFQETGQRKEAAKLAKEFFLN